MRSRGAGPAVGYGRDQQCPGPGLHVASQALAARNSDIIYQGTRIGIVGVSGMMKPVMPDDAQWYSRVAFHVSYFVLFGIIILNTIVGLIVDSFGALRTKWLPLGHSKMLEADQDHAGKEDVLVRIDKKLTSVGRGWEARRIRWHWPRFGR